MLFWSCGQMGAVVWAHVIKIFTSVDGVTDPSVVWVKTEVFTLFHVEFSWQWIRQKALLVPNCSVLPIYKLPKFHGEGSPCVRFSRLFRHPHLTLFGQVPCYLIQSGHELQPPSIYLELARVDFRLESTPSPGSILVSFEVKGLVPTFLVSLPMCI